MFKKVTTRKRIFYFILYSIAIIFVVLGVTVGPKTFMALKQLQIRYLLAAIGLVCLMFYFDVLRLQILASALGAKLSFVYTFNSIMAYNFLSAITPALTGGEPLLVYKLREKGIGVGKGTSIVVIRGILMIIFIAIGGPLIIYYHHELLPNLWFRRLFEGVAVFLLILILAIVYAIFSTLKAEHLVEKLLHLLDRFNFLKSKTPKLIQSIDSWIEELNLSMKLFFKERKWSLFCAMLCTVAFICTNYLLAYVIIKGLNCNVSLAKVFMIQFVLYFLLYFSPTPGGSGVAEGGFYVLFSPLVPNHLLGLLIILWRFFTIYLGVIWGGIIIMKDLGIDQMEDLASEKMKPVIEDENSSGSAG